MTSLPATRYAAVSRRAVLRASLGAGVLGALGAACGHDDALLLAGESARPAPTSTSTTTTTSTTSTTTTVPAADDDVSTGTASPTTDAPIVDSTQPTEAGGAVDGEMVVAFTYTQGAGGKDEAPYVAVWIEDAAGELAETVALWYQQGRRGDRWLDHLSRWYDVNLAHVVGGGVDDTVTVSSATRTPGSYAVVWDGSVDGTPAPAGDYFVCVEAVREEGPYSLIRQPLSLAGVLDELALPDDGELSAASVRIDV